MPTQKEYNVAKQNYRELYTKINLLNFKFQIVDELNGVVIGTPSFSIDENSPLRRSCSISLIPIDSSFDISYGNKIWIDKYIQIYIGIKDIYNDEIVYTNMGIYLINNPNQTYNAMENTISIQGLDLMSKMTGLRNGSLESMEHIIPQNSNVRKVIIATIKLAGFEKYVVEECPYSVPNDIKISSGGNVYDILEQLKNIIPQYQMYFDVDGVFNYSLIPSGNNEQIMVDDDLFSNVLTDLTINTDFENIKNMVEVFGKTHDIKNYGGIATISSSTYNITLPQVTTLRDNFKIGFVASIKVQNPSLKVNSLISYPIKNENGSIPILSDEKNVYYVVKFQKDKNYFLFMGELTPYAISKEENIKSPFYINGTSGKLRISLQGGEYDNIYMSDLAKQRANWELYTRCKIKDSITLTCVPIYFMDVNWLIEITLPNLKKELYITKQINTTDTQTITAMRYYPFYSTI